MQAHTEAASIHSSAMCTAMRRRSSFAARSSKRISSTLNTSSAACGTQQIVQHIICIMHGKRSLRMNTQQTSHDVHRFPDTGKHRHGFAHSRSCAHEQMVMRVIVVALRLRLWRRRRWRRRRGRRRRRRRQWRRRWRRRRRRQQLHSLRAPSRERGICRQDTADVSVSAPFRNGSTLPSYVPTLLASERA